MKIYIDFNNFQITKKESDVMFQGDVLSNAFELLFYNYSDTSWFPTMSQLAPNGRQAGDFAADPLEPGESQTVTIDGVTYLKYKFTIGAGWCLVKGKSNFFIWKNTATTPMTRKCIGRVMVSLNESTETYFIDDVEFNPKVKNYIDAKIDAIEAQLGDGSPKYFDTAANILAQTEDKGLAVATDTGAVYYWDDSTEAYVASGVNYTNLSNYYTKTESDNTFAPKSTAITHTGSQLQDYSGNNVYPNIDETKINFALSEITKINQNLNFTSETTGSNLFKMCFVNNANYRVYNNTNSTIAVQIRNIGEYVAVQDIGNIKANSYKDFVCSVSGEKNLFTYSSSTMNVTIVNYSTEIEKLKSNVNENSNDIKILKRKLKVKYYNTIPVGEKCSPSMIDTFIEKIDSYNNLGVDGFILDIDYDYSNNQLVPKERTYNGETYDFTDLLPDFLDEIETFNKKVYLKMHCTTNIDGVEDDFITAYYNELVNLISLYKTQIDGIIILNENSIVVSKPSPCVNLMTYITNMGLEVSTSIMFDNIYRSEIPDAVINACTFIGLNCYPCIGYKDNATTKADVEDSIKMWENKLLSVILKYPSKKIIITECGIADKWVFFRSPSTWQLINTSGTNSNGLTSTIYMPPILEMFEKLGMDVCDFYQMVEFNNYREYLVSILGGKNE